MLSLTDFIKSLGMKTAICQWPGCNKPIHLVPLAIHPHWEHDEGNLSHWAMPPENVEEENENEAV